MTNSTFKFDYKDLTIDLKQIETVLGYGEGNDRDIVTGIIEEILGETDLFSNIRAEYKIYENIEFVGADKSVKVNNVNLNINYILTGQLKKADSLAFFLCTAGKEIGFKTKQAMSEGDPLKGYICDMLGSIVVDASADLMQSKLEKSVSSAGKKITNRYSPGYCGWDVSEQHKLFRLLPDNFCGIRLTDSALMDPVKSISGIIGIGRNVRFNHHTCRLCSMKNCAYRDLKERA